MTTIPVTELTHTDPTIRYAAAQRLGTVEYAGSADAVAGLIPLLRDGDSKVQYAAFSSLIKHNDGAALHPILDVLLADTGSRLWALINLNIGMRLRTGLVDMVQLGDLRMADRLNDALAAAELNILQRALIIRMIGRTGDTRRADDLIGLLLTGHPLLRGPAAEALGYLGDARAVDALLTYLRDPLADDQIREPATIALGMLGDARVYDDLVTGLKDDNEFVRTASATALGLLGDQRAVELLSHTMLNDTGLVADAAFNALKGFSSGSYTALI